MSEAGTMREGPLGSTIHVLRADSDTVAALAGLDWNRCFRRVFLDPTGGRIVLMAPSRLHEDLAQVLGDVLNAAGAHIAGAARGLRSTRLRGRGEPPGTGMEPDCAFYVGERARGYLAAVAEGEKAADEFLEHNAPDLIVEVEITHADESKIARYAALGVRELWRLHGSKGTRNLRADFLALQSARAPRPIPASQVLPDLTPDDVCEAVEKVRISPTPTESVEAVTRIVERRQRASVRVREEAPPAYAPSPARSDPGAAASFR